MGTQLCLIMDLIFISFLRWNVFWLFVSSWAAFLCCLLISQLGYLFFILICRSFLWILIHDLFSKYLLSLCGCPFCFVYTLLLGINSLSEMMMLLAVSAWNFFIYFVWGSFWSEDCLLCYFLFVCFPFFLSAHHYSC